MRDMKTNSRKQPTMLLRESSEKLRSRCLPSILGLAPTATIAMLKTRFQGISASVANSRSLGTHLTSYLTRVENTAIGRSTTTVPMTGAMLSVIQEAALRAELMFQCPAIAEKKHREFLVQWRQGQNSFAKTNAASS